MAATIIGFVNLPGWIFASVLHPADNHIFFSFFFQNGEVVDALLLWQKLITDKLGKLEECTICYSIVQGGNLSLPKRQCRTCKKLFHSACLVRFFVVNNNLLYIYFCFTFLIHVFRFVIY